MEYLLVIAVLAGIAAAARGTRAVAPTAGRITSRYGNRLGRTTRQEEWHAGVDFSGPRGTPVVAFWPGVVERVGHDADRGAGFQGYGNVVVVKHPDLTVWSLYGHMDSVAPGIARGAQVSAGTPIGAIGSTSNGKFPTMPVHLHFEVRRAKEDGSSPFPGQYSQFNINPEEMLAQLGIRYNDQGQPA